MRFTLFSFPVPDCGCNKTTPLQMAKAFLGAVRVKPDVNLKLVVDFGPKDCSCSCTGNPADSMKKWDSIAICYNIKLVDKKRGRK